MTMCQLFRAELSEHLLSQLFDDKEVANQLRMEGEGSRHFGERMANQRLENEKLHLLRVQPLVFIGSERVERGGLALF